MSITSFNCDKTPVPCSSDKECSIICQRVSDIARLNEISYFSCSQKKCTRSGIPETIFNEAQKDLRDMMLKKFSHLKKYQADYVKNHPNNFVLKRSLYYIKMLDELENEEGDSDDDDDEDDDGEENNSDSDEKNSNTFDYESDASMISLNELKTANLKISSPTSAFLNFAQIKSMHSVNKKNEKEIQNYEKEEKNVLFEVKGSNHREEYNQVIATLISNNNKDINPNNVKKIEKLTKNIKFLCNEEISAGFEITRFVSKVDENIEIPVCYCLHPEKLFGPSCKWRTNYDVVDYDLWEKYKIPTIFGDNIDDYNQAMDFCRNVNKNLVTYFDPEKKTFFCKSKAERVQETLTNNSTESVLSIIESELLNYEDKNNNNYSEDDIRINKFEYSLFDLLFDTKTTMNV